MRPVDAYVLGTLEDVHFLFDFKSFQHVGDGAEEAALRGTISATFPHPA